MKKNIFILFLIIFSIHLFYSTEKQDVFPLNRQDVSFVRNLENHSADQLNKIYLREKNRQMAGVVCIVLGSVCEVSGIALGIIHRIRPTILPGCIPLYQGNVLNTYMEIYFNPMILCINLTGAVLLAVGLPSLIVGAIRAKKAAKKLKQISLLQSIQPQFAYSVQNNEWYVGVNLKI